MNKRRALRSEFVHSYFNASLSPLGGVPSRVGHEIASLKTIVVDTAHLTHGYQTYQTAWTLQANEITPEETAYKATIASSHLLMKGLRDALTSTYHDSTEPAASGSGVIDWSSWYHGESFEVTVAGSIEEVMSYCDLTENEREQIIIQARSMAHGNYIAYGTARGVSADAKPKLGDLHFTGIVVTELHLLSGTIAALTELHHRGINVVYMTAEPEDIATHIATAAHLTSHPKIARHGAYARAGDHGIYARLDRVRARRILEQLPHPVLVARHPLGELVRMLDACR